MYICMEESVDSLFLHFLEEIGTVVDFVNIFTLFFKCYQQLSLKSPNQNKI